MRFCVYNENRDNKLTCMPKVKDYKVTLWQIWERLNWQVIIINKETEGGLTKQNNKILINMRIKNEKFIYKRVNNKNKCSKEW